jgi:hypothetical protein
MILKEKQQKEDDYRDHADRHHLSIQVSLGPLLNRARNLAHPFIARRRPQNNGNKQKGAAQSDDGADKR